MTAIIENSAHALWNFGTLHAGAAGGALRGASSKLAAATAARTVEVFIRCRPFLILTGAFLQNFFLYASITMGCVTLVRLYEHMESADPLVRIATVALSILLLGTIGINILLLLRGAPLAMDAGTFYSIVFGTALGLGMLEQARSPHKA